MSMRPHTERQINQHQGLLIYTRDIIDKDYTADANGYHGTIVLLSRDSSEYPL